LVGWVSWGSFWGLFCEIRILLLFFCEGGGGGGGGGWWVREMAILGVTERQLAFQERRLATYSTYMRNIEARSRNHACRGKVSLHIPRERERERESGVCVCVVCVCVCNLRYPACKAHAPYYVICGLSGCTMFFPHYLINGTIFSGGWGELLYLKCVF